MIGRVDTGFTGDLVIPRGVVESLLLQQSGTVDGILADGTEVLFQTYHCEIHWFGRQRMLEVISARASVRAEAARRAEPDAAADGGARQVSWSSRLSEPPRLLSWIVTNLPPARVPMRIPHAPHACAPCPCESEPGAARPG